MPIEVIDKPKCHGLFISHRPIRISRQIMRYSKFGGLDPAVAGLIVFAIVCGWLQFPQQ